MCARIYNHVSAEGRVPATLIEQSLATLARPDGDIDTLMQRLSGVRVWAYVAARREWCAGSTVFQTRAREVEDLLSDALHERLLARFVDRRAAILLRKLDEDGGENLLSAVTRSGDVVVEGHKVGEVSGFTFEPDPLSGGEDRRLVLRAARRALRAEMPRRGAALVADSDEAFALNHRAQSLVWHNVPVGRLRPGREVLEPLIEPVQSEFLDGAERERIRARLARFLAAATARELAPFLAAEQRASARPELRGLLHRLREQAGIVSGPTASLLDQNARIALKPLGVRAGRYALFLPALTRPRPLAWRALLLAVHHGRPTPDLPAPGLVSIARPDDPAQLAVLLPLGWVEAGPILLRLDIAERIAAELAYATRRRPTALPPGLASRLSVRAELLAPVLRALGIRLAPPVPLAVDAFGPPAPSLMWALERRPRPIPAVAEPAPPLPLPASAVPDNPFAALATLRRRAGA